MGQPWPLFCLFSFFSITILQKNCRPQQIRTRIVGVEGEHADHLTTTTALVRFYLAAFYTRIKMNEANAFYASCLNEALQAQKFFSTSPGMSKTFCDLGYAGSALKDQAAK